MVGVKVGIAVGITCNALCITNVAKNVVPTLSPTIYNVYILFNCQLLDDTGEALDGLLLGLEHLVAVGVLGVVYDGLAVVGGDGVVVLDGSGEHGTLAGDEPIGGNLGAALGDIPKDVRRKIGNNAPSDIVDFVF